MIDNNNKLIELIARCSLKDDKSMKELYQLTSHYLNQVAYNILRSQEFSDDVLQDGFLQIWKNASTYRPDKSRALTWMTSIIRYRALDKLALERRHYIQRDPSMDLENISSFAYNVSHEDFEPNSNLSNCLEKLNEDKRRCIKLAYIYGYSRDELASAFNTNTNTVKSWLLRSARLLKKCMINHSA
ncbi:RNA polymerase sigma factor [Colwellia sp. Bg11-28]|uniref:RNA polymerase sigma factor n=1 Tax=Colwellia sp. Bg11-28 TaxID=2058305 RepID=UPI000C33D332|nr:sigma-70 family RNA polymerase sigma factor [Colwellia sp. Bg11-28]PKH89221.1 RNA polymerase subunit sigma-24 [Colwellia sp. Bg11-28]